MQRVIFRLAAVAIVAGGAFALAGMPAVAANHGHGHEGAAEHDSGTDGAPGKASDVDRTVRIEARDVAFDVKEIDVRPGKTVRFVVHNSGKQRHEFVIASHAEHLEHRAMMRKRPNMKMEDEPNGIAIAPGKTQQLVWKFGKDPGVEFACDLPGHAEIGMRGVFKLVR